MKYQLFLGCTIPARQDNYEKSARRVAEALGIELVDREFGFARPNAIVIDPKTGLLHGGIDGKLPRGLDQVTLGF